MKWLHRISYWTARAWLVQAACEVREMQVCSFQRRRGAACQDQARRPDFASQTHLAGRLMRTLTTSGHTQRILQLSCLHYMPSVTAFFIFLN